MRLVNALAFRRWQKVWKKIERETKFDVDLHFYPAPKGGRSSIDQLTCVVCDEETSIFSASALHLWGMSLRDSCVFQSSS